MPMKINTFLTIDSRFFPYDQQVSACPPYHLLLIVSLLAIAELQLHHLLVDP